MGKYIYNSSLPFVKSNYNGNRTVKNRFTNYPFADPDPTFKKVLQWKLSSNPQKAQKKSDPFNLAVEFMLGLPKIRIIILSGWGIPASLSSTRASALLQTLFLAAFRLFGEKLLSLFL